MKKTKHPEGSFKHISSSIIAFNGYSPIEHFKNDDLFLKAWRARQLGKNKFVTAKAFDSLFKNNRDQFYQITKKLRINVMLNPGEMKAYGFFRRKYGMTKEDIDRKLGISP